MAYTGLNIDHRCSHIVIGKYAIVCIAGSATLRNGQIVSRDPEILNRSQILRATVQMPIAAYFPAGSSLNDSVNKLNNWKTDMWSRPWLVPKVLDNA